MSPETRAHGRASQAGEPHADPRGDLRDEHDRLARDRLAGSAIRRAPAPAQSDLRHRRDPDTGARHRRQRRDLPTRGRGAAANAAGRTSRRARRDRHQYERQRADREVRQPAAVDDEPLWRAVPSGSRPFSAAGLGHGDVRPGQQRRSPDPRRACGSAAISSRRSAYTRTSAACSLRRTIRRAVRPPASC